MRKPVFIALEGIDGSGKTTQANLLYEALSSRLQIPPVLTKAPGGSLLGAAVREMFLSPPEDIGGMAELMLLMADRAQHVQSVITPALRSGACVITDRFSGSSIAYQGYGRGLSVDLVSEMCSVASGSVSPDLNVLIEVPVRVAMDRVAARAGSVNRMETSDAFMHKVARGFERQARSRPKKWLVVDGDRSVEAVGKDLLDNVLKRCSL